MLAIRKSIIFPFDAASPLSARWIIIQIHLRIDTIIHAEPERPIYKDEAIVSRKKGKNVTRAVRGRDSLKAERAWRIGAEMKKRFVFSFCAL
jgi:hypothetical protein